MFYFYIFPTLMLISSQPIQAVTDWGNAKFEILSIRVSGAARALDQNGTEIALSSKDAKHIAYMLSLHAYETKNVKTHTHKRNTP